MHDMNTQLEKVSRAMQDGWGSTSKISEVTGIGSRQVSTLKWHLSQCEFDLEAARKHKSKKSAQSRARSRINNSKPDHTTRLLKFIETHGHAAKPHDIASALSLSYKRRGSANGTAKKLEQVGQSAFYLSDRALEAPLFG